MKFKSVVILSLVLAALSATKDSGHSCSADETNKVTPEAPWNQHCRESMAKYTVREQEGDEMEFKRIPHAVMQHHNPENNDRGLIYLWTQENGVPVVIITALVRRFKNDTLQELHELHSLHDGPLHIQGENGRMIAPQVPGLRWHQLPRAPVPAKTVLQQQLQSRSLSRKFRGIMKIPGVGNKRLHVTPRPLHQYQIPSEEVVRTGSLFAVCNLMDPEALLMLEVRLDDTGKPQWCYACASYTSWGTHILYDDKEVWADDPADLSSVHRGYSVRRGFKLPEADAAGTR